MAIFDRTEAQPVPIAFTIGSRRLLRVDRRLRDIAYSLDDMLSGHRPDPPVTPGPHGVRILSATEADIAYWRSVYPRHRFGGIQRYRRHYIAMNGGFDGYLAAFSSKTRATLRRQRRRFEQAAEGPLDVRAYRSLDEIETFLDFAIPLARSTYQARLLDAALPEDEAARCTMRAAAEEDRLRAFLLFLKGEPIAYLTLPVVGDGKSATLVYAYLGHEPRHANLSPGTVLHMAAMEMLFAEGRFARFDFTEGDGAHKALLGTDSVAACSFVLLTPGIGHGALLAAQSTFDHGVGMARSLIGEGRAGHLLRRAIRG